MHPLAHNCHCCPHLAKHTSLFSHVSHCFKHLAGAFVTEHLAYKKSHLQHERKDSLRVLRTVH